MMKQLNLDDSSYDSIFERAKTMLQAQAPWWTHTEVSDPGITLLEMWAVLTDMQSFYLNQIQESHCRKYLKLLGIPRQEGECARAWVLFGHVQEDRTIPPGTKLMADQMVFETAEEVKLTENMLSGFFQNNGGNKIRLMQMHRKNHFPLKKGPEGELFSFALQLGLKAGERLSLYIQLDEKGGRNPAEPGFCLAQLVWEYWTEQGWREARVIRDDTRGLLFSGIVCLQTERDMDKRTGRGNEIRCRIRAGSYDAMPVIYKILLNVARVIQKNTVCCQEQAEFTEKCHRAELKGYLAKIGEIRILKCLGQGLWKDITKECEIDPPVTADRGKRYVGFQGNAQVKIICTLPGAAEKLEYCPITGVGGQQIPLPWNNVMREETELMLAEGEEGGLYRECRRGYPEEVSDDNVWHWQEEKNTVVLGDGRHGDIPQAGKEGLLFVSLAFWEGKRGNVSIYRINKWEKPELFSNIKCINLMEGWGGKDRQLPSEQFAELGKAPFRENRMVTEDDIQELVRETPGLMIDKAQTVWQDGVMVVKVFPKVPLQDDCCIGAYISRIQSWLEGYRLAGSRLRVELAKEE